jgi:hypothetical protein
MPFRRFTHSLVPPVIALAATALELLLTAGLLGRQTLFGGSLPVLRAGFIDALLPSAAAAFFTMGSGDPAIRDAGRLQFDETVAFLFARPFSASLSFGEGLLVAFGGRGDLFALNVDALLQ